MIAPNIPPCGCGNPAAVRLTVTDTHDTILDTTTLCPDCLRHPATRRALDQLNLQVPPEAA